jgi:hypothetical protein
MVIGRDPETSWDLNPGDARGSDREAKLETTETDNILGVLRLPGITTEFDAFQALGVNAKRNSTKADW